LKTVLVTGANGGLGQAVVKCLRNVGHYRVVATDLQHDDVNIFQLDIRDHKMLAATVNRIKPDLILHLAATFADDLDEAYTVNVDATRHLLDVIWQAKGCMRILLIGSAAEYGVVRPEENPIREDRVLRPVSINGLTKAWQTQLAGLYAGRGVDVVVARIFNLDGPGLSERLFIGRLQKQIDDVLAKRKSVIELGPLSAIRDYVTTTDAANQILAIATYAEPGRVYHVASGIPVTMRDMLIRYLGIYGLDPSIVRVAVELSNRKGYDVPTIYADVSATLQLMRLWRTRVKA
jgi:nucleoside-diphosphate-sugar epimerase